MDCTCESDDASKRANCPVHRVVSLTRIAELLAKKGCIGAYVEHTGGGCATLYVGTGPNLRYDNDEWGPRYALLAGPGYFRGGEGLIGCYEGSDFCFGPDDDGDAAPNWVTSGTEVEIAETMFAFVRARANCALKLATAYTWHRRAASLPPAQGEPFAGHDTSEVIDAEELYDEGRPTGRFVFPLWPYNDSPYGFVDASPEVATWHLFGLEELNAAKTDAETDAAMCYAKANAKLALIVDHERTQTAAIVDDRCCSDCRADILGNDPHAPGCPRTAILVDNHPTTIRDFLAANGGDPNVAATIARFTDGETIVHLDLGAGGVAVIALDDYTRTEEQPTSSNPASSIPSIVDADDIAALQRTLTLADQLIDATTYAQADEREADKNASKRAWAMLKRLTIAQLNTALRTKTKDPR